MPRGSEKAPKVDTSRLPKPRDPHIFESKDIHDYTLWRDDVELFLSRYPQAFADKEVKAKFGARYVSENLRIL